MKKILGAIITPFTSDGTIDLYHFNLVAKELKEFGINGLVVATLTGEGPSISLSEKGELLNAIKDLIDDTFTVYMSLFNFSTKELLADITELEKYPCTGYVISVPPLVQPGQAGIIQHLHQAATVTQKPFYLFSAPGRISCSLQLDTVGKLGDIENFVGIINESNDLEFISACKKSYPDKEVLVADERILDAALKRNVDGILSSALHLIADDIIELIRNHEKDIEDKGVIEFNHLMADLINCDNRAVTIKYFMKQNGLPSSHLRLPLTSLSGENKKRIDIILD